jgi:hypothetical protein
MQAKEAIQADIRNASYRNGTICLPHMNPWRPKISTIRCGIRFR